MSRTEPDVDAVLHDEPPAFGCPLCFRFAELEIVVHEESRN